MDIADMLTYDEICAIQPHSKKYLYNLKSQNLDKYRRLVFETYISQVPQDEMILLVHSYLELVNLREGVK